MKIYKSNDDLTFSILLRLKRLQWNGHVVKMYESLISLKFKGMTFRREKDSGKD